VHAFACASFMHSFMHSFMYSFRVYSLRLQWSQSVLECATHSLTLTHSYFPTYPYIFVQCNGRIEPADDATKRAMQLYTRTHTHLLSHTTLTFLSLHIHVA
jgi:hypothetical protein